MRDEIVFPGNGSLVCQLVDLSRNSVGRMRGAGHGPTKRDRVEQVVAVMVCQLGRLFLQPLVDQIVDAFPEVERPAKAPKLAVAVRAGE